MNQPLPKLLARMDQDRIRRYRDHLDFYHGRQWLPTRLRTRNLTFNYAKTVVEKTTSYLMSDISFTVEAASPEALEGRGEADKLARAAELALSAVYEQNNLAQLDFDTELDTAVLGDGCYKVTWDPETQQVRVTAPDVQGLYAWWAPDDPSKILKVATRYLLEPKQWITEVWTNDTFDLYVNDNLQESRANPYQTIPFVIYPNLRTPKQFWGESDLVSLVEPSRELNRAISQLSNILELSGNPIAVLENVAEPGDIAVAPGAIWEVPEKARAYLLDLLQGGGVQLHASYIDLLYRTIHDLSETPRTSFGDNQRALSGVALEMELHPLLQKIKRKRLIRTAAYKRRNGLILKLLSQFAPSVILSEAKNLAAAGPPSVQTNNLSHLRLGVHWGPVLPQDRTRLVDEETALVTAGIHSRRRAADLLGVPDPDAEYARWLEERVSDNKGP